MPPVEKATDIMSYSTSSHLLIVSSYCRFPYFRSKFLEMSVRRATIIRVYFNNYNN